MVKINKLRNILRISLALARVNFNLRIEGSYLGILWYLLNPLVLFVVLFFVKETAFAEVKIDYYPLYLLIGIAGFNFFKQAISGSIDAISSNYEYIKSINNIAPETLVISAVIQAIFSHIFEFILIFGLAIYLKISLLGLLFYPIIFLVFVMLVLGISFIFATVGVYVSDLNNVWIILSQLIMLATPIFYGINSSSLIYKINLANPLFYFLEAARSIIITSSPPTLFIMSALIIFSLLSFIIGVLIFKKHQKKFAELL
jgi:ABC-type polysaccharide/polyol phosphate export permease